MEYLIYILDITLQQWNISVTSKISPYNKWNISFTSKISPYKKWNISFTSKISLYNRYNRPGCSHNTICFSNGYKKCKYQIVFTVCQTLFFFILETYAHYKIKVYQTNGHIEG